MLENVGKWLLIKTCIYTALFIIVLLSVMAICLAVGYFIYSWNYNRALRKSLSFESGIIVEKHISAEFEEPYYLLKLQNTKDSHFVAIVSVSKEEYEMFSNGDIYTIDYSKFEEKTA